MKNKITTIAITGLAVTALAFSVPVFAQQAAVTSNYGGMIASSTRARMRGQNAAGLQQKMANGQNRGAQMIDQRITSLNNLITRIQGLKNVSDTAKASLTTSVEGVLGSLNTLKTEIGTDTSTTTLRANMTEITQANRVYALVIPQANIIAAGDRVETIVTMMNGISTKLQARIASATSTPAASSASTQTAMTDLTAKLSDANTQAAAAMSEVSGLTPDQGDKTKMASNTTALKDARMKIQTASKDVMAARKDISTVMKALGTD